MIGVVAVNSVTFNFKLKNLTLKIIEFLMNC